MTTHELYLGGNGRLAGVYHARMFPSPTFSSSSAAFAGINAAQHKKTILSAFTRTLAFGRQLTANIPADPALYDYVNKNDIVEGDVLNLQVIPANTLLFGLYANVENPETGVRLSFGLDDGTTFGGAEQVAPPVQADGSTADTGGTVPDGTLYYVVTAITALGETTASNEKSIASTGGDTSVNTINWSAVTGATGYRVYRGTVSGTYTHYLTFGAVTTGDDTTGTGGTAGSPPTVNTSGNTISCGSTFSKFSVPNGTAWISAGAASMTLANFSNVPRVLQATVRALPDTGFGRLRISVSPLLLQLQEGCP